MEHPNIDWTPLKDNTHHACPGLRLFAGGFVEDSSFNGRTCGFSIFFNVVRCMSTRLDPFLSHSLGGVFLSSLLRQ